MPNEVNIRNKRASFDYEFLEEYNAGIVLTGTEIKSIRAGKASLVDSYCFFNRGELWVKGMHIAEYKLGTYYNHEEKRERKLLLTHKELILSLIHIFWQIAENSRFKHIVGVWKSHATLTLLATQDCPLWLQYD